MSWSATLMSTWQSAGGEALADLGPCAVGSSIRRELSERGLATIVIDARVAAAHMLARRVVRIDTDATYFEFRTGSQLQQTQGVEGTVVTLTGYPRLFDWSDRETLSEVLDGRVVRTFDVLQSPIVVADRFLFRDPPLPGLEGLVRGVWEFNAPIALQWSRWTPGQLLAAIIEATKGELQIRRLWDGTEAVDLLQQVGATAPTLPVRYGDRLLTHQTEEDYNDLCTRATLFGDAPGDGEEAASIAENCWRVASAVVGLGPSGTAPWQVELREIDGTRTPVLRDGMFRAHADLGLSACYLERADGTTRAPIVESFAATGVVHIAGSPPVAGEWVRIVADAEGTPLEMLALPDAMRAFGDAVGDIPVTSARGERQYARNGGHEEGLERWSSVNGGVGVEYARSEFGSTIVAAADGARAAGESTATPFAVKSLGANQWVRQGDRLDVGGDECLVDGDTVAETDGALSFDIAPGLPGDFADGDIVRVTRREVRTLELDTAQSVLSPFLSFKDVGTDNIWLGAAARDVTLASAVGGFTTGNGVVRYRDDLYARAGAVLIDVRDTYSSLDWATISDDIVHAIINDAWLSGAVVTSPTGFPYGFTGASAYIPSALVTAGTLVVGTRLRLAGRFYVVLTQDDGAASMEALWWPYRISAIASDPDAPAGHERATLVPDLVPGISAVYSDTLTSPLDLGSPEYSVATSNTMLTADSSWTLRHQRETRALAFDGSHALGALHITSQPQSVIARRDWTNSDGVIIERLLRPTIVFTAGVLSFETLTATIDTAASTIDSVNSGDYSGGNAGKATLLLTLTVGAAMTTGLWTLVSIVGTTATFTRAGSAMTGVVSNFPQTRIMRWRVRDAHAVSASASWGNNRRVTLTIPAVAAGRTYPRGSRVWANWHTEAAYPEQPLLRLYAQVNAAATSIELYGTDAWGSADNPADEKPCTCYALFDGDSVPLLGNTLFVAESVQANGAGEANVVLQSANVNAIADSEVVTIARPALLPVTLPLTGSAMRVFNAVGGDGLPTSLSAGMAHELGYVRVPTNATRRITAIALFALSRGEWLSGNGPVVALVDEAGAVLGSSALGDEGAFVEVLPGLFTLTAQAAIAQSGRYGIRVYGGSSVDYAQWCVHVQTMFTVSNATNVPYLHGSFASLLQLTGSRTFVEASDKRITDALTIAELDRHTLVRTRIDAALIPHVVLGGYAHLEEFDRRVRVVAHTLRPDGNDSDVELGAVLDGGRLVGSAANAAGVRGTR